LLRLDGVSAGYRRLQILHEIDLEVRDGEIVALIGANGAGKTTTLRAVSGMLPVTGGRIVFDGERIDGVRPDRIVRRGLVHVPQERALFGPLTVMQNLQMGAYTRGRDEIGAALDEVMGLFPILDERRDQRADTLSGGQQQMLAIARAMMLEPKIILLDEPTEGLMPRMVSQIRQIIDVLCEEGVAVLLVEQNVPLTLEASQRIYIMEKGAIRHHAPAADLKVGDAVIKQYLGV